MKQIYSIGIVLIIISTRIYANDTTLLTNDSISKSTMPIKTEKIIEQSSFIEHSGELNIKSNSKSIFEFLFPSLIALAVGFIAYYATISSSKKQIESNKETIEKQIESSLKIAELDFRKTVLSNNRQQWINDLRVIMSELLSLLDSYSINIARTT